MHKDIKDLYIALLTHKGERHRVAEVAENDHRVCLARGDLINPDGDFFDIGGDIYGTFKIYTIVTRTYLGEKLGYDLKFHLCPNIDYFRNLFPWR